MSQVDVPTRSRWTFSLRALLIFALGVAVGLTPIQIWRWSQPEPEIRVHLTMVEVPDGRLDTSDWLGDTRDWQHHSSGDGTIRRQLEALVESNEARLVAEPTLVTLVGRQSRARIGEEFPIPTQSESGATTIECKHIGIEVSATPTAIHGNRVTLTLEAMKSAIDAADNIEMGDPSYPRLQVASCRKEVQLTARETFALLARSDIRGDNEESPLKDLLVLVACEIDRGGN
ncbi:MAG: hypothetical protein DWQ31_08215 [Planctomycetota bacterium]|nr:MAG: hypothetical protein DWQ31_08215 [Planctomycetota bacterium]REJ89230.1 MAG: hypothetical protein DWQ35_18590 [Planctomycetota bacterium]REK31607.1 MAG: hypothetical protein DWQ42_00100 [Planctomycetota bacterium]REK40405.1 MAG: hypothetical protein DWQ46_16405 [Planctomycetota bacterium]